MPACPTNSPHTNSTMLCVYGLRVYVQAHTYNNMDLLLNSEHRTGEYDVEKLFVCVCMDTQHVCV